MGETMLLVDARPGDVLVDREGDVWRCTEDGAMCWSHSACDWGPCMRLVPKDDELFGPLRRATARDLERIPVEQRPALPGVLPVDVRLSGASDGRTGFARLQAAFAAHFVPLTTALVLPACHAAPAWSTIGEVRHGAALLAEYRRLAGDRETSSFRRFKAEVEAQRALLAEYQRLASTDATEAWFTFSVPHERALTPTELAALGRKPIAPQDPLGWEVE